MGRSLASSLSEHPGPSAASAPVTDFDSFIRAYKSVLDLLDSPDRYRQLAESVARTFAAENVLYAEIFLSAGQMVARGLDVESTVGAVCQAFAGSIAECGLEARFVLDVTRHHDPRNAWKVLEAAIALKDEGVVALGLGGDERRGPASEFVDVFAEARAAGLYATIHAGEVGGPDSVRSAIECGAQRIGHGVRVGEDPSLLVELAARRVAVEVCPTSNLCTGSIASLESHPARAMAEAGIPIVVGSDDPAIFGTTLSREYDLVAGIASVSGQALARAAADCAFLPDQQRAALRARLERALGSLENNGTGATCHKI